MKRFRFKLQTVLDQRKAKEQQVQTELGEVMREEAAEVAHLAELINMLDKAVASVAGLLSGNRPASELSAADEYAKALRDDVKVQHLTIMAVRSRVEAKREELAEAMKERKVLDTLREKQEREHVATEMRAEQNQLDDIAGVRYARGL